MISIECTLENITTDEPDVIVTVPMAKSELKAKLMPDCDYLIVEETPEIGNYICEDIFELNEALERIQSGNPAITTDALKYITRVAENEFTDDDFLEAICSNDFMYEEADIPEPFLSMPYEFYAAYYLYNCVGVPFCFDNLTEYYVMKKPDEDVWEYLWDIYSLMGFKIATDDDDDEKIYIMNFAESDEGGFIYDKR